ncbi:MAG: hypothetical protein R3C49_06910 [Planctomycetaceae bacterium]
MNPFAHLVWKEYRSQRALWMPLTIAAVGIALWSLRIGDSHPNLTVLNGMSLVFAVAFGVGAVTVAFVGEEDEGTAIWLRMFPLTTRHLLCGKLLVIIAGILSLLLLSLLANAVLFSFHRNGSLQAVFQTYANVRPKEWVDMLIGLPAFVLLALVASLTGRKAFRALGLGAAGMVLFATVCMNTQHGPQSLPVLLIQLVLLIAVVPLAGRWHRGLRSGSAKEKTGPVTRLLSAGKHFLQGREEKWIRRLQTAASRTPLSARTFQTLLWRELRFAVPFYRQAILAAVAVAACHVLFNREEFPWLTLFSALFVIECGLRTFRHDQQQLNGLFWSHRGVSPGAIWAVRMATWLGTLVCVIGTILLLEWLTMQAILLLKWLMMELFFADATVQQPSQFLLSLLTSTPRNLLDPSFPTLLSVMAVNGFVIAALMSAWNPKPLIAAFCALVAVPACWALTAYLTSYNIPLWLTIVPLTIIWLVAGFVTRRQWADRRISPGIAVQRFAWIGVPLLCMIPVQSFYRAHQIPDADQLLAAYAPDHSGTGSSEKRPLPGPEEWVALGYSKTNTTTDWANDWQQLSTLASVVSHQTSTPSLTLAMPLESSQSDIALACVDRILANDLSTHRLPPDLRIPWSNVRLAVGVTNILTGEAQRLFELDQKPEALQRCVQAIRLAVFLRQEATSWEQWLETVTYELFAGQVLQRMLFETQLTDDELQNLQTVLSETYRIPSSAPNIVDNRAAVYFQLLDRKGYLWDEHQRLEKRVQAGFFGWPLDLIQSSASERYRCRRLIELLSDYRIGGIMNPQIADLLIAWQQTTPGGAQLIWHEPAVNGGRNSHVERLFQAGLIQQNALRVLIALRRYQTLHGNFPASLFDLEDAGIPRNSRWQRNPFTESLLGYAPSGIGVPVPMLDDFGKITVLSPDQPILFSEGRLSPAARSYLRPDQEEKLKAAALPADPQRIWFLHGSTILGLGEDVGFWARNIDENMRNQPTSHPEADDNSDPFR